MAPGNSDSNSVSLEKFGVAPFYGSNASFSSWKFRVELALKSKQVHSCIQKKSETDDEKNDILAQTIIVACLSDNVLEDIKDCSTAYDMWITLNKRYERTNMCLKLLLESQYSSFQMKSDKSLDAEITRFDELVRQMKNAKIGPSEDSKCTKF